VDNVENAKAKPVITGPKGEGGRGVPAPPQVAPHERAFWPHDSEFEPLVTAVKAAKLLGCLTAKRLRLLVLQHRISAYRFGRSLRFRVSEVAEEIRRWGTARPR
jgi:hypothetical protein